ncbi:hypothetical protein JW848_07150 [Candidatus Bipolaricaulota bacterium]|nr:hypothetical protein [Candidatus Bipolaricaulota bacterium]
MRSRLSYFQALAAGQLGAWIRQCCPSQDTGPRRTAGPFSLAALAQYASALVLSDGVILTNGPNDCRDLVPDWGFAGWTQAYDSIEEIVLGLEYGLTDIWPCADPILGQLYEALSDVPCETIGDHLGHVQDPNLEVQNFLAWEFLLHLPLAVRADGSITTSLYTTDVVRSIGGLMARVMVEAGRSSMADSAEDSALCRVLEDVDGIQLPLILAALMSRIDRKEQFLTELEAMRNDFARVRQHITDMERLLAAAACGENTGRELQLLMKAYRQELTRTAGVAVSPPAPIERIAGLELTVGAGTGWSEGLVRKAENILAQRELRVLARWPQEHALETIGKLRTVFATHGAEESWNLCSQVLQTAGTLAWYPLRSANHDG